MTGCRLGAQVGFSPIPSVAGQTVPNTEGSRQPQLMDVAQGLLPAVEFWSLWSWEHFCTTGPAGDRQSSAV